MPERIGGDRCVLVYLQQGGTWKPAYWTMIHRIAQYTSANWHQPDSGIWELSPEQHYVSSKVRIEIVRTVIQPIIGRSVRNS